MQKRSIVGMGAMMTLAALSGGFSRSNKAISQSGSTNCSGLPTAAQLQLLLQNAPGTTNPALQGNAGDYLVELVCGEPL